MTWRTPLARLSRCLACMNASLAVGVLLLLHGRRKPRPLAAPAGQEEIVQLGLYNVAVSYAAAEAQMIWARFNAMLVANTLVGAIIIAPVAAGRAPPEQNSDLAWLVAGIAGLCLAVIWHRLTVWGWRSAKIPLEYAGKFHWTHSDNLMDHYAQKLQNSLDPSKQDRIQQWALRVIWLFGIAYVSVIGSAVFFLIYR